MKFAGKPVRGLEDVCEICCTDASFADGKTTAPEGFYIFGTTAAVRRIRLRVCAEHVCYASQGAFRVLDDFEAVDASTEGMKALTLQPEEEHAFATAALALRFGERTEDQPPPPITAEQLIEARRPEDLGHSPWTTFQRVQENTLRGGQPGLSAHGRRIHTRAVGSIDRRVSLNRALWVLAEEMRRIRAAA